jgi:hypothetical protein
VQECQFKIVVKYDDNLQSGNVAIETSMVPPQFVALLLATEHMMNLTALSSQAGYDNALQLLVEGARRHSAAGMPGGNA